GKDVEYEPPSRGDLSWRDRSAPGKLARKVDRSSTSDLSIESESPWYSEMRDYVMGSMRAVEFEAMSHPVACLSVVSTSNHDPVAALLNLFNQASLPSIYEKGFMDPNILRFYILLHDGHVTSDADAASLFLHLKKSFGLQVHLLRMNSVPPTARSGPVANLLDLDSPLPAPSPAPAPQVPDVWSPLILSRRLLESVTENVTDAPSPHSLSPGRARTPSSASTTSPRTSQSGARPSISSITRSASATTQRDSMTDDGVAKGTVMRDPLTAALDSDDPTEVMHHPLAVGGSVGGNMGPIVTIDSVQGGISTLGREGTDVPVVRGTYVSREDFKAVEDFVREFAAQSVVPFMERTVQTLNEQVASSRRGLTGRLFSAGRKYFGGIGGSPSPRPGTPGVGPEKNEFGLFVYPFASPESQLRRLADYAFMLRDYRFASSLYDTVRKDYRDGGAAAGRHYAACQEMMAVCALLEPGLGGKIDALMESAVGHFRDGQAMAYAIRAAAVVSEGWKSRGMWKDAALGWVKVVGGDDSDLRAALFLEQAAYSLLRHRPAPMHRKSSFHLVLAGHRYNKSDHREHAARCYYSALMNYDAKGWSLIEDHVNFTLGKQAYRLGDGKGAMLFLAQVLGKGQGAGPVVQEGYLKELLFVYDVSTSIQRFCGHSTVNVSPLDPGRDHGETSIVGDDVWTAMERELAVNGFGESVERGSEKRGTGGRGRTVAAVG
ncbi:Trafficking protein particle complex 8, partial [Gonapodya sp. JEL0774]